MRKAAVSTRYAARGSVSFQKAAYLSRFEKGISLNLGCTQGCCGVSGEEGIAGTSPKDDNATTFKVADGPPADVGLCHLAHFNGCLHTCRHSNPLQCTLIQSALLVLA